GSTATTTRASTAPAPSKASAASTYSNRCPTPTTTGCGLAPTSAWRKGLTFNTSYTFSKSIDNNSAGSSNPQAQDYRDLSAERALSDFDARQRFVLSGTYLLPFKASGAFASRLVQGWTMSPLVNLQSGSPFSPIIAVTDSKGSLEAFNRPSVVACVP